jgi:GNAT superfamily N-acetyltransferase
LADPMSLAVDESALAAWRGGDLPMLEKMVRDYYREDGHHFEAARQKAALDALIEGEPLGRGWLVVLTSRPIGYVVLTLGFSVEAGGREGCLDEFFLVPEVRGRGLGRRVLDLVENEARALGVRRLFLEVEHGNRAIALYRRAGFVDHRRYLMSKPLAQEA